jgi:hypothetical protein
LSSFIKNGSLALCKHKHVLTYCSKINLIITTEIPGVLQEICTVWFSVVDPDPHQSDKQDLDPYESDNQDQDPDTNLWFADPQHWSDYYLTSSSNYKIFILKYEMMNINGFKNEVSVDNLIMGWAG